MRKLFSLFLALVATTSLWAQRFQVGDLYYNITSSSAPYAVEVTDAALSITIATIPETVTYNGTTYSVTSIGEEAFNWCTSLTSITIPNSVTSIGEKAFRNCSSLTKTNYTGDIAGWCNIKFGGATSNPMYYSHNLYINDQEIKDLVIPNTVDSIHNYAFYYCSFLTSVTIPNSVTSIGYGAFRNCSSLTSVTIPNSVTSIGNEAFYNCSSLTKTNYTGDIASWCNIEFFDAFANPMCYSHNFYINDQEIKDLVIPNTVDSIHDYAFYDCSSLTSVTIPNSVTNIGNYAFQYCHSLTSVTIPNSVTRIGHRAFDGCSALEYLSIPNSVQYASEGDYNNEVYYYDGYSSIYGCYNLKTLIVPADFFGAEDEYDYPDAVEHYLPYLPEKLEALTINSGNMSHRFGWDFINRNRKSLKHIDFATTESIEEEAFTNFYNLESLVLPSHLETVPYMAVAECVKLKSISIPATVTAIEDRAFENCRMLSSVAFAENGALTRIGNWAFYNNHELTNLVIPEGVTEVGHAAFYGCTYLKEMTLPSTVQEIADNGFTLCAKLRRMNVDAIVPPTVAARTFEDVDRTIPVVVPDESVSVYKSAPVWQEFNIQGKSEVSAALDNIHAENSDTRKLLRNGQLLILRDGKTYNVMGAEIQ